MVVQPSPGASAVPLSIEPVIGWRLWCIEWDKKGGVVLTSPMRPYRWRPMVPNHAGCHRHVGKQVPTAGCMCGMYAVSRLDRLPTAFGVGSSTGVGVVGSVAMWGRVVEHAHGYRGQLAYPDRIRLICRECFFSGREGVPTRIERDPLGNPLPACETHAIPGRDHGSFSPDELQQMLLSTYAVDPLPVESLHEAGFGVGHPSPNTFAAAAKAEARELSRSGSGVITVALLIAAFFALRAMGVFSIPGTPEEVVAPSPAAVAGPFADDVVSLPPVELAHPRPERGGHRALLFGTLCGHRIGIAVQMMACGRARAELLGFYSSPPEPRRECNLGTAYSRKRNLSVCWFDLTDESGPPLDLLRLPGVHLDLA